MNIIYRGSDKGSTPEEFKFQRNARPLWYDKRKCFKSLFDEMNPLLDKLYVIFDGSEGGLLSSYIKNFSDRLTFINIKENSNKGSLLYCYNFGKALPDNNPIYFVEDDYLHSRNSIDVLRGGVLGLGLATLYDHPDRYKVDSDDLCAGQESIRMISSKHWRTAESTTGTWAARRDIFNNIVEDALKFEVNDRAFFRHLYSNKKIRLWQVIPGMSTHMDIPYMSPIVNWKQINNDIIL